LLTKNCGFLVVVYLLLSFHFLLSDILGWWCLCLTPFEAKPQSFLKLYVVMGFGLFVWIFVHQFEEEGKGGVVVVKNWS
jgi:FtsH-binding integral membrane protein